MLSPTAGEILHKTPATAYVADQAPAHAQGRFQSLHAGGSISGQMLAPPLGGALYTAAPGLLRPVCAILARAAGVAVPAARRLREPKRPAVRAQGAAGARGPGSQAETGSHGRPPAG